MTYASTLWQFPLMHAAHGSKLVLCSMLLHPLAFTGMNNTPITPPLILPVCRPNDTWRADFDKLYSIHIVEAVQTGHMTAMLHHYHRLKRRSQQHMQPCKCIFSFVFVVAHDVDVVQQGMANSSHSRGSDDVMRSCSGHVTLSCWGATRLFHCKASEISNDTVATAKDFMSLSHGICWHCIYKIRETSFSGHQDIPSRSTQIEQHVNDWVLTICINPDHSISGSSFAISTSVIGAQLVKMWQLTSSETR